MSLARALTTRRAKQPSQDFLLPQRSNTTAKGHGNFGTIRNKISGPMELTHTTNMLAYNAPDLFPHSESSPTESIKSDDSSDTPSITGSSPPTSPDMPSTDGPSGSPEPNHLSCYFTAPGQKTSSNMDEAPKIPQRAPSHTKKASYDNLANKIARFSNQSGKSISTMKSGGSLSRSSSTSTSATSVSSGSYSRKGSVPSIPPVPPVTSPPSTRASFRRTNEHTEAQHPFGNELAQVSELAEELGMREDLQMIDEEEQQLISKGLYRFRPEDYLAEVQGLFSTFFKQELAESQAVWI
ncbi:hypothetical protein F4779DRAFT_614866 [Xylariaceae sp. FL0662B]|nr:hypothetical protein F4779DRAFT_614866 [Xylariaceae sp. FL0662B]